MNKYRNGDVGYTAGDFEQLQSELEAVKAERDNLIKGDWTPDQYHAIIKSKNIQQLSLEQQAQGVEDAYNHASKILRSDKYSKKGHLGIIDLTAELYEYKDSLRNQAKALKGEG